MKKLDEMTVKQEDITVKQEEISTNQKQAAVKQKQIAIEQKHNVLKLTLSSLNPWAAGAGSARSEAPEFRNRLTKYYKTSACMVSDVKNYRIRSVKKGEARFSVTGAHLWPNRANPNDLAHLGLAPANARDCRNGLLLSSGIEKAFDALQVTFLLNKEHSFVLRVLDDQIAAYDHVLYSGAKSYANRSSGAQTFSAIDGMTLKYGANPPYRRILWLHAHCALAQMEKNGWTPVSQLSVTHEADMNVFRRLSGENPYAVVVWGTAGGSPDDFDSSSDADDSQSSAEANAFAEVAGDTAFSLAASGSALQPEGVGGGSKRRRRRWKKKNKEKSSEDSVL